MMKILSSTTFYAAFFVFSVVSASTVHAQERLPQAGTLGGDTPSVDAVSAGISITDASLGSVVNRDAEVTFTVQNDSDVVKSNLTYAVRLLKVESEDESGRILSEVDEHYYGETFSLAPGASVVRTVDYNAPNALRGDFVVNVDVTTTAGLPQATRSLSQITLPENGDSIYIDTGSCVVGIEGDEKTYGASFGIDIAPNENAYAECDIINGSSADVSFIPEVTLYTRSAASQSLSQEEYSSQTLAGLEKRTLKIPLPVVEKPQVYVAAIRLVNSISKEELSNTQNIRYVLQGQSGSVQSVTFDKVSYKKGDTANVSVLPSARADQFPQARGAQGDSAQEIAQIAESSKMNGFVMIKGDGGACSGETPFVSSGQGESTVQVAITQNCMNPQATVRLETISGAALDEVTFAVTSGDADGPRVGAVQNLGESTAKATGMNKIVLFAVVGSILLALIILLVRRKGSVNILVLMGIVSGTILLSTGQAQAAELWTADRGSGEWAYLVTSVNQDACNAPVLTAEHGVAGCGNPGGVCSTARINGDVSNQINGTCVNENGTIGGGCSKTYVREYTLANGPQGSGQSADLFLQYQSHCGTQSEAVETTTGTQNYQLNSCAASPTCGSAHGTTRSSQPDGADACASGGPGGWWDDASKFYWTCTNSAGQAQCSANKPSGIDAVCGATGGSHSTMPSGTTACPTPGSFRYGENTSTTEFSWRCAGVSGGSDSPVCTASRTVSTPGACNPAVHDSTQVTFPANGHCASGSNFLFVGDSGSRWDYQCQGSGGGSPASCWVNRSAGVDAVCGPATGVPTVSSPSGNDHLCAVGIASNGDRKNATGEWVWNCLGQSGGNDLIDICTAPSVTPNDATCGSANGVPTATQPTGDENLCSPLGSTATNGIQDALGNWTWDCISNTGGADAIGVCSAPSITIPAGAPSCGAAADVDNLFAKPITDLCATGTATPVQIVGDQWEWRCAVGLNSVTCNSLKECSGPGATSCKGQCQQITLGGDSPAHNPQGGPVNTTQYPDLLDTSCYDPMCRVLDGDGNFVKNITLGEATAGGFDVLPHGSDGSSGVTFICTRNGDPDECDANPGHDSCDTTITTTEKIKCVCAANKCNLNSKRCIIGAPVFGAESGSSAECSSECHIDPNGRHIGCEDTSIGEGGL